MGPGGMPPAWGPPLPGAPNPPGAAPVTGGSAVDAIRAELETDIRRIEEENSEIDMLMEQVLIEIERHEARRVKLEERLNEGPSFAHVSGVEREAIAERGASGFHVR